MEVDSEVWIRDEALVWCRGIIVGKELNVISVEKGGKDATPVQIDLGSPEPPESVHVCNSFGDGDISAVNDLIKLNHLHEPAILHALEERFKKDIIYTATGSILLAVNPFKPLAIYTNTQQYHTEGKKKANGLSYDEELLPHVFELADNAFHKMVYNPSGMQNQSILVSGESGAGKTETTKYIMKYIATIAGSVAEEESIESIEKKVLQSNPIMEAFGNARTIRNDNSSRFGKYIKLQFRDLKIVGASVTTYLLEKVRIVVQAKNERNYHIFYEMMKGGGTEDERKNWSLPAMTSINCMNQSGCYDKHKTGAAADDGDDGDSKGFELTSEAMATMGVPQEEQGVVFGLVAAVMHLSMLEFSEAGDEGSCIASGAEQSNRHCARLLNVEEAALTKALTSRKIKAGHDQETEISVTADKALNMRDGLAKALYSQLFETIVARINKTIRQTKGVTCFVGILDIFGFEIFERNGFEQLCINYANETLQQQFNQFVFKMEQEEYEKEQIEYIIE
jgi:myosin-5